MKTEGTTAVERTIERTFIVLMLAWLVVVCGVSCGELHHPKQKTESGCSIADYGQGVFYFYCAIDFGTALAEFRKTHELLSITSYSLGQYGTDGYWVVTR